MILTFPLFFNNKFTACSISVPVLAGITRRAIDKALSDF
jgi:hypothetical protein